MSHREIKLSQDVGESNAEPFLKLPERCVGNAGIFGQWLTPNAAKKCQTVPPFLPILRQACEDGRFIFQGHKTMAS
jgi:hypothetical protein